MPSPFSVDDPLDFPPNQSVQTERHNAWPAVTKVPPTEVWLYQTICSCNSDARTLPLANESIEMVTSVLFLYDDWQSRFQIWWLSIGEPDRAFCLGLSIPGPLFNTHFLTCSAGRMEGPGRVENAANRWSSLNGIGQCADKGMRVCTERYCCSCEIIKWSRGSDVH